MIRGMDNPFAKDMPSALSIAASGNADIVALLERALADAKDGKIVGFAMIAVAQLSQEAVGTNVETRSSPAVTCMLAAAVPQLTEQLRQQMFPEPIQRPGPVAPRRLSS